MFGVAHCQFFSCCMNGANHLEEDDLQPMFLCPGSCFLLSYALKFLCCFFFFFTQICFSGFTQAGPRDIRMRSRGKVSKNGGENVPFVMEGEEKD